MYVVHNVNIVHIVVIRCTICGNCREYESVGWLTSVWYPLSEWPTVSCVTILSRKNWMIYQGPGFLAVAGFGSSPILPPHPSKIDRRHTGRLRKRDNLLTGEGGGGGGGAKSYDSMKAWSSINHSKLSDANPIILCINCTCVYHSWICLHKTLYNYVIRLRDPLRILYKTMAFPVHGTIHIEQWTYCTRSLMKQFCW